MRRTEGPNVLSVSRIRNAASVTLQVALLAVLILIFFLRAPVVSGLSMEPRIANGEHVLIDTLSFHFRPVVHGEIIAFSHDATTPIVYLKRVIGLPGDRIEIDDGNVIRNGMVLDERYVRYPDHRSFAALTVPAGDLYVLGDNRADSDDSRAWGFVPESQVIGQALMVVWPPDHVGRL
ncbi:signal peptidase I [bacterium]|nr:MAG: signal peptidase I [bacterium]